MRKTTGQKRAAAVVQQPALQRVLLLVLPIVLLGQILQVELQLLPAVGAHDAAIIQNVLVEEELLLAVGTGSLIDRAVLIFTFF